MCMCLFVCLLYKCTNTSLTWEAQSKISCIFLFPYPPYPLETGSLWLFGLRQLLSKLPGSTYLFKKLLNFTRTHFSTLTAISLAFGFLFKSPYLYLDLVMVYSRPFPLALSKFWTLKGLCHSLCWKTRPHAILLQVGAFQFSTPCVEEAAMFSQCLFLMPVWDLGWM